jgi:hypothetical protein
MDHRERVRGRSQRQRARRWSVALALLSLAGCAAQDEQGDAPDDGASGSTAGGAGSAGNPGAGSGGASAGSAGSQAGMTAAAGANGGGGSAGAGGASDGGNAGMSMAGTGGASAGTGGQGGSGGGGGGAGGTGGAGGSAGAGGKAGSAGMSGAGGSVPVDPCDNDKKDGSETDVDCGGTCTTQCGTGKMCDDLSDCIAKNVCDTGKCRADGCSATNCAYTLTRFIIGSTAVKGQVFVSWDSDSFDVEFEMLDATPFDDNADSALNWQDDSVEIYLDLNNAKTTTYQADDFQVMVPRHAGNNVVGIGTGLNTSAVMVTRTTGAAGYTLAITIPWTALNNAAYPSGKTIGFDVAVNDDSDGGDRNSQIMLYGSAQNYLNTSQFGTLDID